MYLVLAAALLLAAPSPDSVRAQEKLREGQHLLASEQFEEAAQAFREAIRFDPLLTMAHYGLGQSQMALKQYPSAVIAFEGARDAFESRAADTVLRSFENEQARQDRVRSLRDRIRENQQMNLPPGSLAAQRRDQRVQQLEVEASFLERPSLTGVRSTPDIPPGILLALGSAHFRSGNLPAAEREYRAALAAQPKLGETRNNLAVVLLLTGRPAEASEQLKMAEEDGFKVSPGLRQDVDKALATASAAPRD